MVDDRDATTVGPKRELDRMEPPTWPEWSSWRRRRRRLAALVARITALVGVLALKFAVCDEEYVPCLNPSRDAPASLVVLACAREYETADPEIGVQYAHALARAGNDRAAATLATALLATSARADAMLVLGRIAMRENRLGEAVATVERAREHHRSQHRLSGVAETEETLAAILLRQQKFAEALRMLDRCIADARVSGHRLIEGYCHLAAGKTLARLGMFEAAGRALDTASPLLEAARDKAVLDVERGNLAQELGENARATVFFQRALPALERAQLVRTVLTVHFNLAYSLAETGHEVAAHEHLELAKTIDHQNTLDAEGLHLEGRISYRRGHWKRAAAALEQAYRLAAEDDDERMDIAALRAKVSLASQDLVAARQWGQRSVHHAEAIRQNQQALEVRAWALSSRREPYHVLFSALARAGEAEQALMVFDRWYGRTLLEALWRAPAGAGEVDLESTALQTETLHAVLPYLTTAPVLRDTNEGAIREALQSVDLLLLAVAEGTVWRIVSTSGQPGVSPLGEYKELRPMLDHFQAHPTDPVIAAKLGDLFLPDQLVRSTDDALRVVLDGELSSLPVAALRRKGRPLIAYRPMVRAPRLSILGCHPSIPPPQRPLVLADAKGDLKAARGEALRVAALLGTTAILGDAATSAALLSSRADFLHIATHGDLGSSGGVLFLHDRPVSAYEILKHSLDPARVVLASCDSGIAAEDQAVTSLATAFLAGGASQVVATLRPVSDTGSEQVTRLFYGTAGVSDPVRALRSAQHHLSNTDNVDWPYFTVFGQESCQLTPQRDPMLNILLVKSETSVAISSQVAKELVPLEPGTTISYTPEKVTVQVRLGKGIYKYLSDVAPTIQGSGVEVVRSDGKDLPTDPDLEKIKSIAPKVSDAKLREFLVIPNSKGD
jgi:tetratricopeptide (TPR) repeat protein